MNGPLVNSTMTIDCVKRLVFEMIDYVLVGTLKPALSSFSPTVVWYSWYAFFVCPLKFI